MKWKCSQRLLLTCSFDDFAPLVPPGTSLCLQIWFPINSCIGLGANPIVRGRPNRFIWSRVRISCQGLAQMAFPPPVRQHGNHDDCVKQQNPQKRDRILTFSMSSGGGEARKPSRESYFYVSRCVDVLCNPRMKPEQLKSALGDKNPFATQINDS